MIEVIAVKFLDDLMRLEGEEQLHVLESPEATIFAQDQKGRLISVLRTLECHCMEQQLVKTLDRAIELRQELEYTPGPEFSDFDKEHLEPKTDWIFKTCGSIRLALHNELEQRKFAYIPVESVEYFEQDKLFGPTVYDKFGLANDDIKNAGNCLAEDLYDACVFHLMLAANHALLRLAAEVGVAPGKRPVEYKEWHILIERIDSEITENLKPIANAAAEDKDLEFYRGLLMDLKYIKEAHRNPIAHARGDYDRDKAVAVLGTVRRFMQKMAERI